MTEGQHGKDEDGRHHGEARGDAEKEFVHAGRDEVFLEEELHAVGDRLDEPGPADAVGSDAILDEGADFAFRPHGVGHHGEDDAHDDGRFENGGPSEENLGLEEYFEIRHKREKRRTPPTGQS